MSSHMRETILAHLAALDASLGDMTARRAALQEVCDRLWAEGIDARLGSLANPIRISGELPDGAYFTFHAGGDRAELVVWDEDPGADPDPHTARSVAEIREWRGGFAAGYLPPEEVEATLHRMLQPHLTDSQA